MMKKKIVILFVVIAVLIISACGVNKTSDRDIVEGSSVENIETNATAEKEENISNVPTGEITEEVVRNYPVTDASKFEYEVVGEGIRINEYIGDEAIVHIPETIDGKNVVEIASYTFANDSIARGVYIPSTVKKIAWLFTNNSIIEVVICEEVEEILDFAFGNCALLHTVILGDKLMSIGDSAFAACPNLTTLLILPENVEIIEEYDGTVFIGSNNLTIIGQSGSTIEAYAKEHGINFQAK